MALMETYTETGKLQYSTAAMHYFFSAKVIATLNTDEASALNIDFSPGHPQLGAPTYFGGLAGGAMLFPDWTLETHLLYPYDIFITNSSVPMFASMRTHTPTTITLYRFRPFSQLPIAERGPLGLQLFNDAGELLYDASKRALTCVATVNIASMTSGMNQPLGLPSGRTYAWKETEHCRMVAPLGANYGDIYDNRGKVFNANQLALRQVPGGDVYLSESNKTRFATGNIYAPPIHIFDVTGL